jgi:hypothetical protein
MGFFIAVPVVVGEVVKLKPFAAATGVCSRKMSHRFYADMVAVLAGDVVVASRSGCINRYAAPPPADSA